MRRRPVLPEQRLYRATRLAKAPFATGDLVMKLRDGALVLAEPTAEDLEAISAFMDGTVTPGARGGLLLGGRVLTATMLRDAGEVAI
jgi:hypothetical protein